MKKDMLYKSYILAFGPHPDDVEVGAGGVIAQTSAEGKRNVIIDLSPSQMSTYGDPITRQQEAQVAASMLGVNERKNLGLPDTQLTNDPATKLLLAEQIRYYKPEVVFMPRKDDRHPDHTICAELVKQALFLAGLPKQAIADLPPHKPRLVLHYQIWHEFTPDVVLPLSDEIFTRKMAAFKSYVSQEPTNGRGEEYIMARHITQGRLIGSRYGEGFKVSCHGVGVTHLDYLVSGCF